MILIDSWRLTSLIVSLVELYMYPISEFEISLRDCVLINNELQYIFITLSFSWIQVNLRCQIKLWVVLNTSPGILDVTCPLGNTQPMDTMVSFWSILSWYTRLAVITAGFLIIKYHDIPNNTDNKYTPRKDELPQVWELCYKGEYE